jgi:superfamily II RNA helicase
MVTNVLVQLCDERGVFRDDNFAKLAECFPKEETKTKTAMATKQVDSNGQMQRKLAKKPQQPSSMDDDVRKITKLLKEKKFDPVIFFSFSRR